MCKINYISIISVNFQYGYTPTTETWFNKTRVRGTQTPWSRPQISTAKPHQRTVVQYRRLYRPMFKLQKSLKTNQRLIVTPLVILTRSWLDYRSLRRLYN